MTADGRSRFVDAVWLVVIVAVSTASVLAASAKLGPTFDEPFYLDKGLIGWRSGSIKALMRAGTMPLPVDAQTLPLYLWERSRGAPFRPYEVDDLAKILPVARAMTLPFWWLLLLYGYRFGRLLGRAWPGRLASGFLAAEPNLLGHAALATTDIPLTAMVLVATYHWFTNRGERWPRRVLLPGILYGLALAAKASALAFVPILWGVFGLCHLTRTGVSVWPTGLPAWQRVTVGWRATARLRWDMVYSFWIGFAVLFGYCGCDWEPESTFIEWAEQLPPGGLKDAMLPVSHHLTIFTNAGEGLAQQVKHNIRGHHGAYILGEWQKRAAWYYFPVALTIKLPEVTLGLLALLLVAGPRRLLNPAGWAALALLVFSLNARVQIGVRLVFPLVAFLLIAMAVALDSRRRVALGFVALAGMAITTWSAWPDGVRYTNHLWGPPDRGYELLCDSNYDWGQGVPDLREWWETHGRPELFTWYYGADPAILRPPFHNLQIHLFPLPEPTAAVVGGPAAALVPSPHDAAVAAVGSGDFAVGTSLLYGSPDRRPDSLAFIEWLKSQPPVGRTGTFVIYHFR